MKSRLLCSLIAGVVATGCATPKARSFEEFFWVAPRPVPESPTMNAPHADVQIELEHTDPFGNHRETSWSSLFVLGEEQCVGGDWVVRESTGDRLVDPSSTFSKLCLLVSARDSGSADITVNGTRGRGLADQAVSIHHAVTSSTLKIGEFADFDEQGFKIRYRLIELTLTPG